MDGAALVSAMRTNNPADSPSDIPSESPSDNLQTADRNNGNNDGVSGVSGVSLVQETRILSTHTKHLFKIDDTMTSALTGIPSDCRNVLRVLRKEALEYRSNFGEAISIQALAESASSYLHGLTLSSDTRPLAVSVILCSR